MRLRHGAGWEVQKLELDVYVQKSELSVSANDREANLLKLLSQVPRTSASTGGSDAPDEVNKISKTRCGSTRTRANNI